MICSAAINADGQQPNQWKEAQSMTDVIVTMKSRCPSNFTLCPPEIKLVIDQSNQTRSDREGYCTENVPGIKDYVNSFNTVMKFLIKNSQMTDSANGAQTTPDAEDWETMIREYDACLHGKKPNNMPGSAASPSRRVDNYFLAIITILAIFLNYLFNKL